MADPVSILAIAALVYAGKKLSVESKPPTVAKPIDMGEGQQNELAPNPVQQVYEEPDRVPEWAPQEDDSFKVGLIPKRELPNFGEIAPQGRSSGAEILGMRDRVQYDTGRMNNLAPIEKVQVGPGLGVGARLAAFLVDERLHDADLRSKGLFLLERRLALRATALCRRRRR